MKTGSESDTTMYVIERASRKHRETVERDLFGLDLVSPDLREKIVVAWMTSWSSSVFEELRDVPWSKMGLDYALIDHVNEVTRIGISLAKTAKDEWGTQIDPDILIPILILHDVDKPLLYKPEGEAFVRTYLATRLPHGVIGGMLCRDLGFDDEIVEAVSIHSPLMPFQGVRPADFILHYADHFACDNALLRENRDPLYFLQAHP